MSEKRRKSPILEVTDEPSGVKANFQQLADLELMYTFADKNTLYNFLNDNAFLVPLLFEGYTAVKRIFRLEPLSLGVFTDFEEKSNDHLVLSIATGLDAVEALKELDKLDSEWWLDNFSRAKGKLSIDLEFR